MPIDFAKPELTELSPRIAVIGVGGAGCNAVNNMISANLQGVEFVVANTDAQSLANSLADNRLQLGVETTSGLGAGAQPQVGQSAAEESLEQIETLLNGCHMAFITAGMGGGTGTGAAPVIAQAARAKGILTVGVVTKPFQFEGGRRMKIADAGIEAMAENVDTLIIIPNQNLFRVANERTTFAEAFTMADEVLHSGVRGVTDLMVMPGLINLDFADVRTVMSEMGKAMMGTGEADGDDRAVQAASAAIANPLLEDTTLKGAKGVIINVTGGMDMTLYEVDEAVNMVREQADPDALIVFGSAFDEALSGKLRVSVVATGIEGGDLKLMPQPIRRPKPEPEPAPAPAPAETPEVATDAPMTAAVTETADTVSVDTGSAGADMADAAEMVEVDTATLGAQAVSDDAVSAADTDTAESHTAEMGADTAAPDDGRPRSALADLEARALAGSDDSFVAGAPAQPKARLETLSQPGSEADSYSSGSNAHISEAPAEPEQSLTDTETNAETAVDTAADTGVQKPTLFRMMTSVVRSKDSSTAEPAPQSEARSADIDRDYRRVRLEADAPSGSDVGGISGGEAGDAGKTKEPEPKKSQLEIPSFLTRQRN